jgi:4-hydroxy-tetrahydrodipicolinate synthase
MMNYNDNARSDRSAVESNEARLSGVWNIVPTPFTPSGDLDVESIHSLVDFVVASGVQGMTVLGVAGEASKLTDRERSEVVNTAIARADNRVPVCVGANAGSTAAAVTYAREAIAAGAHSILLAPAPGSRLSDEGLLRHYLAAAEAIDAPIVVQDHPNYTGVRMSIDLLASIAAASPMLQTIKLEASPTPPKVRRLVEAIPGASVLGGLGGIMLLEEMRNGAAGVMTGFGYPEILVDIVSRFKRGDVDGATEVFYRYCPAIRFEHQEPIGLSIRKLVYQRRGAIRSAHVRAPAPELDRSTVSDLDDIIERLGLDTKFPSA